MFRYFRKSAHETVPQARVATVNARLGRCAGQGFKPDLGNSAVRHYRGASGNVAMAELRTHLATERVRVVALRLKQTRPSSIPTVTGGESNFSAESPPGISDYNRSCETLHHQNDERLFHVQVPTL
jgi:hypothetical protein